MHDDSRKWDRLELVVGQQCCRGSILSENFHRNYKCKSGKNGVRRISRPVIPVRSTLPWRLCIATCLTHASQELRQRWLEKPVLDGGSGTKAKARLKGGLGLGLCAFFGCVSLTWAVAKILSRLDIMVVTPRETIHLGVWP